MPTLKSLLLAGLLLSLAGVGAGPSLAQSPFASIVERYVLATNLERPNDVLAAIHTQSAFYTATIHQMQQVFPLYNIQVEPRNYYDLGSDGTDHVATVTLTYRKATGPAFQDNETKNIVTFRQENGTWKIWTLIAIDGRPIS